MSSNTGAIDTALAPCNSEETVFTPAWAPRVGDDPVVGAVFVTPTSDLDSVTAQFTSTGVSVDTTLVIHEVLVDSHGSLNRAVLDKVGLDGSGVVEGGRGLAVVLLEGGAILAGSEVLALEWVGTVVGFVGEAAVSDETVSADEPPGEEGSTTVATVIQDVVAGEEVLRGEDDIDATVGGDTESVGEDFRGSESPA